MQHFHFQNTIPELQIKISVTIIAQHAPISELRRSHEAFAYPYEQEKRQTATAVCLCAGYSVEVSKRGSAQKYVKSVKVGNAKCDKTEL